MDESDRPAAAAGEFAADWKPGDPVSDARISRLEGRVSRLEEDMADVKYVLRHEILPYLKSISQSVGELKADVAAIKATLPHLATKTELEQVKTELKTEIGQVRTELKAEIADVKTELKAEIADVKFEVNEVKTELKAEIADVKTEMKAEITEVRIELKTEISGVREEVAELRGMVMRQPTTIQLGGFVIAIFMAAGIMRYFFGP